MINTVSCGVSSGSTLFAQARLSEYIQLIQYTLGMSCNIYLTMYKVISLHVKIYNLQIIKNSRECDVTTFLCLKGMDTFSGEANLSKYFSSLLKRALLGEQILPFRVDTFSERAF